MKRFSVILYSILLFAVQLFPQGSVLLVGGGSENYGDWSDKPYKWLVEHSPNRKIIVLHYADTTTWFTGYFPSLSPCTVSNLFINSAARANDSAIYKFILQHDGIFLRGGDQGQYYSKWNGTLTQKAITEVFRRGGVVGGTSAGEMILSNVSYLAGNSDNGAILTNPSTSITLIDDFLPFVPNALAESHTSERGRLGRLPVFLARYKEAKNKYVTGIAVDANTALAIGTDGIGEVMGSCAVALLRWGSNSSFAIEPGKPFAMQNMKFDQLIPGYKYNLNTGEIIIPPTAVPFIPKQISLPKGLVILDGSGNQSDWAVPTGSIKKFTTLIGNNKDNIGIISSFQNSASAEFVKTTLNTFNVNSKLIYLNEAVKNDQSLKSDILLCSAFIFVGNIPDSIALLLSSSNLVGSAFWSKVSSAAPLLFLSEDVMLAGEYYLGGIYSSLYSAYYGILSQQAGLNLVKGLQFIPRFYQNKNNTRGYDYSESRIMGLFWSMAKSSLSMGMLIDAGTYVVISEDKIMCQGVSSNSTPVLLFDASNVKYTELSQFKKPGRGTSVQNAAIIGGSYSIIRPGEDKKITSVKAEGKTIPDKFFLEQNFPNPFNPITNIRFTIAESGYVKLKIYDILGQVITELFNQYAVKGNYEVKWNASNNCSGIYFCGLEFYNGDKSKSTVNKMILIK